MAGNLTAMIAAAFSGSAAPPVTSDPYFEYTTLLLPGNGTNGAQNNTFLDSSANNFTITRNGNTTQGTFSPFSQTGWGVYFDGNNDNCTSSTALFNYTTGNASTQTATVEAWVYLNAYAVGTLGASNPSIAAKGSTYMNFGINPSGNLELYWYDGTTKSITSSGTVPLNTWVYVAFTLSGGTATLYINGSSSGSGSWTGLQSGGINSTSYFGNTTSGPTTGINGYLSNLRVSTTARSISTPTSAFSNDGNTAFLSFQSNRFVDNSSNTYAITPSGNTSVVAFSPFNPSASWSAATYGGSGYFDGNGDYLQGPVNSAFAFGTGEYCMEGWIYMTSAPASPSGLIDLRRAAPNYNAPWLNVTSGYKLALRDGTLGADVVIGATNIQLNTWTHVAVTRQVTSNAGTRIFLNGVLDANSITNNSNYSNGALTLATAGDSLGSFMFTGYMSDVRITKGSVPTSYQTSATTSGTAVFTPPTSPETTTSQGASSPSILLNFTNAGIYDATSKNDLETVGDAQISTTQSKWGGSSIYLDGTGDWLTNNNASNSLLAFGTGDFTIEGWFYSNNASSAVQRGMFQTSDTIGGLKPNYTTGVAMHHGATAGELSVYVGSTTYSTSGASITTGAWFYFAITRSSGNVNVYVNGVSRASGSGNTNNLTGTYISVGGYYSTSYLFDGYLQDFRITKGYARTITASPTAAFPTL